MHNWANRLDARAHLPHLLRRLIQRSTPDLQRLAIRTGEGIQLAGWDGITESENGSMYVPMGVAAWEFGTNNAVAAKANSDYEKRTNDPDGIDQSETSYVFVTPRRWSGKDDWVRARQAERVWKNVHALDADDLHAWLEAVPAVHIWFSQSIGKAVDGAESLETFAAEWLGVTWPPLPEALVTSGREAQVTAVVDRLNATPTTFSIKATTRAEAIVFLFAALSQLPEPQRNEQLERAVIVRNPQAWRALVGAESKLILIPFLDDLDNVPAASRHGHHVYIPLESDEGDVSLPLLQRAPVERLLAAAGVPEERARKLSQVARRSLSAVRRQLSPALGTANPEWSRAPSRALLAAMLAGEWDGSNEHDQQILEGLSGLAYVDLERTLLELKHLKDPPVRQRGRHWMIAVKTDAWMLLLPFVTRDQLTRFRVAVSTVLETVDPALELPSEQRFMASLLKKVMPHSHELRSGLTDTLAVMGAYSDQVAFADGTRGQGEADAAVRSLLANATLERWTSLAGQLTLLAEASPTQFLEAVERHSSGTQPLLAGMFTDSDGIWGATSLHTYVLWALEGLAWHPDYLSRAAFSLLRLHRLDPGGKTTNRPMDSLRRIFLLWQPCTLASLRERLDTLEALAARDQESVWHLRYAILPKSMTHTHDTSKPKHRTWLDDFQRTITIGEVVDSVQETIAQLVQRAPPDAKPWMDLLELLSRTDAPDAREGILAAVERLDPQRFPAEDRRALWEALEEVVARHRRFQEAPWALRADAVDRLDRVHAGFTPDDPVQRSLGLFSHHPLRLVRHEDPHESWAVVAEQRRQALEAIHAHGGMAAVDDLIRRAKDPMWVGHGLAQTDLLAPNESEFLEHHINGEDLAFQPVARYYVSHRLTIRGSAWLEEYAERTLPTWSAERQAAFLICLPFEQSVWQLAKSLGADANRLYWSSVNAFLPNDASDLQFAVEELLEVDRPVTALHLLSGTSHARSSRKVDPDMLIRVLQACVASSSAAEARSLNAYDVGQVLDALEADTSVSRSVLASLEFSLLPIFRFDPRPPRALHAELANNPRFFAELVEAMYKPESGAERDLDEHTANLAHIAHQLLDGWTLIPGSVQNGQDLDIDGNALRAWIAAARAETEARDRKTMGLHAIAEMLSHSPSGRDGFWPHEAVRDALEELEDAVVSGAFHMGRYNQRGVTTRGVFDGGDQERDLAAWYARQVTHMSSRWPRTAAILRDLERTYLEEARLHDLDAEKSQDRD
jgi:hypothetical protein